MRKLLLAFGVLLCLAGAFLLGLGGKVARSKGRIVRTAASAPSGASSFRQTRPSTAPDHSAFVNIVQKYEQLPLGFEPNWGQASTHARFLARGSGYTVFLTPTGTVLALRTTSTGKAVDGPAGVLRLNLMGSNARARFSALDELPGKSNYLIGNIAADWHTNIPNYRKVAEQGIYPGIDLVYYGTQRQLEYDFVVAPHADPHVIRLAIQGVKSMHINQQGELIASASGGELRLHRPAAYQQVGQAKQVVAANYILENTRTVAFHIGEYDPDRPLIIDPILSYSTYLGGRNIDGANAIAVATDGSAFIAGGTFSADFPTAHPLQPNAGGPNDFPQDAFVAKLSADGSTLLYSTYLGGENEDVANGIAVDAFGNAYVTGTTLSPHFPVTPGSFNTLCGSDGACGASLNPRGLLVSNGFVTKLNPAGSALIYSGFVGNYEIVRSQAIAVDSDQIAYVTGQTGPNIAPTVPITPPNTPPPPFPITASAFQPVYGGGVTDAFVMKISATGSTIQYSSYLGGSDEDVAYGIAVDNSANAYVTGLTYSGDFPTKGGAQSTFRGAGDAFFAKVNTDAAGAASLLYSTFLGGSGLDQGNGVAVDSSGRAYVAGTTSSSTVPFTTTNSFRGGGDAFAAKLDPTQTGAGSLIYFTYLGGTAADSGAGIAVDVNGNAYVTGSTVSTDFPTTAAVFQHTYGGGNADAFVIKLDPTGSTLVYSSFLGGSNTELGTGIAVDTSGSAYVTGLTCSQDFPLAHALQAAPGGNCDAFVSKVTILAGIALNPAGLVFPAQSLGTASQPQTVTLTNGDAPLTITSIALGGDNPGDFTESNTCSTFLPPGGQCTITVVFTPTVAGIRKASVTITDSAPGSPHVLNLTGSTSTITLSSSSLSFGNQPVGVRSSPQAVRVTNNGTVPLTFSSITASGDFAETDDCTKTPVQPTTNCVINVTFTPSAVGSSVGALTLTDNAPGSPQIVLLTGTGFVQQPDFTLSVLPPSAAVVAGKSAQFDLTITPISGFSKPIALSCSGVPAAATCSVPPNPVTPSGTTTVTVTVSTGLRTFVPPSGQIRLEPPRTMRIVNPSWLVLLVALLLITIMCGQRGRRAAAGLVLAVTMMLLLVACSGGSQSGVPAGTPAGTYQVNVVGTSGSITHTATISLQVQ